MAAFRSDSTVGWPPTKPMELTVANTNNRGGQGFFRRLCRILKKEVTGHGPPDACLSGVIFVPRNNPVRQLPTNAMRLPRARAMRPVRHQRRRREERAKHVVDEVPDNPPSHLPRFRRRSPTPIPRRVAEAEPNAIVLRPPQPRSPSPTRDSKILTLPAPPPRLSKDNSHTLLPASPPSPQLPPSPPSPPPPPTPPTPLRFTRLATPPPPPSMSRKYDSPPPPPPLDSPPSSPGSSLHRRSEQYISPPNSRVDLATTLDMDKAIVDIESDEDDVPEHVAGLSATMSSGIRSIDRWMLSRSEGSTIKSDGTPSPTNTNTQHTVQRRRAWEIGKQAWTPSADTTGEQNWEKSTQSLAVEHQKIQEEMSKVWNTQRSEESDQDIEDDDMHSALDGESGEIVNSEAEMRPMKLEPELKIAEGTVQQRVQEWIRDGETSVRTQEWRSKNGNQTSGLQQPLVQRHSAEDAPPSAKLYRAPARTREETEAQKRAREWVGATSVARRARAWDALADNDAWEIEARRNRALPRTINRRDGRRARTDVHEIVAVEESEHAHDDFIEFQTRTRKARGARILSNVSSLLGNDNVSDSEGDSVVDTQLDQQTLRTKRRPVASVLRRAKLLSRLT